MDAARKAWSHTETQERTERPFAKEMPGALDGLEKVLRFSAPARETETERAEALTIRDVTNAMNLVHEAAQRIRAAEERSRDAEGRTQALVQRATEELKAAEARVHSAEARVRALEARAQDAEARAKDGESRAKDAEAWLRQIFSTISDELPVTA